MRGWKPDTSRVTWTWTSFKASKPKGDNLSLTKKKLLGVLTVTSGKQQQ